MNLEPRGALRLLAARFGAALGRDQWIGSLEPGKRADLVAVDGWSVYDRDPVGSLIDQSRASSVRLTMVEGVVRYRRPEVPICL